MSHGPSSLLPTLLLSPRSQRTSSLDQTLLLSLPSSFLQVLPPVSPVLRLLREEAHPASLPRAGMLSPHAATPPRQSRRSFSLPPTWRCPAIDSQVGRTRHSFSFPHSEMSTDCWSVPTSRNPLRLSRLLHLEQLLSAYSAPWSTKHQETPPPLTLKNSSRSTVPPWSTSNSVSQ